MLERRQLLFFGALGAMGLARPLAAMAADAAAAPAPAAPIQLPTNLPPGPSPADYQDDVRHLADLAVEAARQRPNSLLNFTPDSLHIVDDMLAEAAAHTPPLSEERRREVVQAFGSYVLEVARREFGGSYQWAQTEDAPVLVVGDPDFQISLMTWSHVAHRLTGDAAASVTPFYQGFADRTRAATPGDKAAFS